MKVIPVLRIFDYKKAIEFYIEWLGFKIDWEHRFSDNSPIYIQISKQEIILHLSEHHGDCSPGAKVFIEFTDDLRELHSTLSAKSYRFNKPGLETSPWNSITMELTDPFMNRLLFSQPLKHA